MVHFISIFSVSWLVFRNTFDFHVNLVSYAVAKLTRYTSFFCRVLSIFYIYNHVIDRYDFNVRSTVKEGRPRDLPTVLLFINAELGVWSLIKGSLHHTTLLLRRRGFKRSWYCLGLDLDGFSTIEVYFSFTWKSGGLQSRADMTVLLHKVLKNSGSFPLISSPSLACGPPPHDPTRWHSRQQDRRNKERQSSTHVISSGRAPAQPQRRCSQLIGWNPVRLHLAASMSGK